MVSVGPLEAAILFGACVLLVGAKRLPDLARSLGLAKGEYQKAVSEVTNPSTAEQDMERGGMTEEVAEEQ